MVARMGQLDPLEVLLAAGVSAWQVDGLESVDMRVHDHRQVAVWARWLTMRWRSSGVM